MITTILAESAITGPEAAVVIACIALNALFIWLIFTKG